MKCQSYISFQKYLWQYQITNQGNLVLFCINYKVSVERLFSSLKFILNDLRSNLGANVLEQIMILRSNLVI
ncbi:hypothetical protein ACI65C_013713 [Semiaphis heraclei]